MKQIAIATAISIANISRFDWMKLRLETELRLAPSMELPNVKVSDESGKSSTFHSIELETRTRSDTIYIGELYHIL